MSAAAAPLAPAATPAPEGESLSLLLVEDNPLDAELVQARLETAGLRFTLERVATREAYEAALARARYDLILSDFRLPGFDGNAALALAQARCPECPFIFVSGALGEELAIETLKRGATDYVLKDRLERLVPSIQRARREAHERQQRRRAQEALRFLAEASVLLASSLDYPTTLARMARLAVPFLADWCMLDLDEGGRLRRVEVACAAAEDVPLADRLRHYVPAQPHSPAVQALAGGRSRLIEEVPPGLLEAVSVDAVHLALLREVAPRSAMLVPLVVRGRALGVLSLVTSRSGRRLQAEDLQLAEELVRRASVSVENALLFRAEQETRQGAERAAARLLQQQRVAEALAVALTPAEVARVVTEALADALGAHAAVFAHLCQAAESLELLHTWNVQPEVAERYRRLPLSAPTPITECLRQGRPVLLESGAVWRARYPELGRDSSLEAEALAAVPVVVQGQPVAALALSFGQARTFGEEDELFLRAVAQQCALALERARLFEAEQRARAQAEAAIRSRDEFLAVVSHDLRNPLSTVTTSASLVRALLPADESTSRARRAVELIHRSVDRMSRLLQDLLDLASIESGRLSLQLDAHPLEALVEQALDVLGPLAAERGQALDASGVRARPVVRCDADRIFQVLSNLVGNAVKFSPEGATIFLGSEEGEGGVRLWVRDTGPGIPTEHLPHIFNRFWKSGQGNRKGVGLGLSIARGIVEAHGGRLWVESTPGEGSTFLLTLPRA